MELAAFLGLDVGEPCIQDPIQRLPVIDEQIRKSFQSDFIQLSPGPPNDWSLKIEEEPDGYTYVDQWGTTMRMPKNGGLYFDFWKFPVTAELDSLKKYSWPDPADPGRWQGLRERALKLHAETDYAICGSPLFGGGVLEQAERIIGFGEFLLLLVKNRKAANYVLSKICEVYEEAIIRFLDEVGDLVQVVLYWDDVAGQDNLLISPRLYRELIKPKQKRLFDTIRARTKAKIFYHTDGAVRELIPDFIDIGVDILQPVQVNSRGMGDTKKLKQEYGDYLTFWGASCDTQETLPYGSPSEIREETKRRILDRKPGGGYVFAPIHNLQTGISPANIMAMYETFFEYRDY